MAIFETSQSFQKCVSRVVREFPTKNLRCFAVFHNNWLINTFIPPGVFDSAWRTLNWEQSQKCWGFLNCLDYPHLLEWVVAPCSVPFLSDLHCLWDTLSIQSAFWSTITSKKRLGVWGHAEQIALIFRLFYCLVHAISTFWGHFIHHLCVPSVRCGHRVGREPGPHEAAGVRHWHWRSPGWCSMRTWLLPVWYNAPVEHFFLLWGFSWRRKLDV